MSDIFWELLCIFVLGVWLYWLMTTPSSEDRYNRPEHEEEQNS